jgi:hypothetical protein
VDGVEKIEYLLPKVKKHLIIQHDEDDEMICDFIRAALDYAEEYQKVKYGRKKMPPATEQAVIMLSGFFYESRDGATGGLFADFVGAVPNVWQTINRLLALGKRWEF